MKTYGTLKSAVAEINKLQEQLTQHKKYARYARKASDALHIERKVFKASYFAVQKQKLLLHTVYLAIIATLLFTIAGAK